jgi:hypothetical protein
MARAGEYCPTRVRDDTLTGVLYAAYGSNLDPHQMAERCPHSPLRSTGWLMGWRITFGGDGWDGALPTLAEDSDSQIFVALDDFEGGKPSARTLGLLADAAEAAGAPADYVAELRSRPCNSGW